MAKSTNDNTLKGLGFDYQDYIALEYCLNADEGDTIFIEQRCDIATKDIAIEVKHHARLHKISDKHEDFWKTLKNFVKDYDVFENYKSLILLTTSNIEPTSKLAGWNTFDTDKKLKTLTEIKNGKITEGIKDFVNIIFDAKNQNILLNVLNKFTIKSGEPRIEDKITQLSRHKTFNLLPPKNKVAFLNLLCSYIRKEKIENPNDWKIEITNFLYYIECNGRNYVGDNVPIPNLYKNVDIKHSDYQEYTFVKEIEKIDFNKKIKDAIKDYFRTQQTINNDLANNYNFDDVMRDFEDDLLQSLTNYKDKFELKIISDEFDEIIKLSKECYLEIIEMPVKPMQGYDNKETWFQRGTIHNIVNKEQFIWLLQNTNSQ